MRHFANTSKPYVMRDGCGNDFSGYDMSGMTVYVEDYAENIWGRDWVENTGNPGILGYLARMVSLAKENPDYAFEHPGFADDVAVYVHDENDLGHVVHLAELIDPQTGECAYDQCPKPLF